MRIHQKEEEEVKNDDLKREEWKAVEESEKINGEDEMIAMITFH